MAKNKPKNKPKPGGVVSQLGGGPRPGGVVSQIGNGGYTPPPLPAAAPPVGAPVSTQFQPIPVPTLTINANGILELPYNNQFSSGMLDAVSGANNQLLDLKTQADQQALEYSRARRDTDKEYDSQRLATKNASGSRGTLFSSQYGTAVANNATNYANRVSDIESQNSAFQQDQNTRRTAIQQALQRQLGQLAQEYADNLNQRAAGGF